MHQAMGCNPDFQTAGFAGFPPSCASQFQYCMAATMTAFTSPSSPASSQNYTGCTFNFFLPRKRDASATTAEEAKGEYY